MPLRTVANHVPERAHHGVTADQRPSARGIECTMIAAIAEYRKCDAGTDYHLARRNSSQLLWNV